MLPRTRRPPPSTAPPSAAEAEDRRVEVAGDERWSDRSRCRGPPRCGVEVMVADIAGDDVRYEVPKRPPGGSTGTDRGSRDREERSRQERDARRKWPEPALDRRRVGVVVAIAGHDREGRNPENAFGFAPASEPLERFGGQDEDEIVRVEGSAGIGRSSVAGERTERVDGVRRPGSRDL